MRDRTWSKQRIVRPFSAPSHSRRSIIRGAAAGLGSLALGNSLTGFGAPTLEFAPATFDVSAESALIWVRGRGVLRAGIQFGTDASLGQSRVGQSVDLSPENDFTAVIPLDGLTPGVAWYYRIVDAGTGLPLSDIGRFRTAPTSSAKFSFAWSADMDEAYKPFRLYDVIAAQEPDFFLNLGDTVYADLPARQFWPSLGHYRRKHAAIRDDAHLQKFMRSHATFATWDDHETENDCDGGNANMDVAMRVFREFWPCRSFSSDGLYRRFVWAGVDFLILDTRRFRAPQSSPDGPGKSMLGAVQKEWFLDALRSSAAPFKFIATSVPFHGGGADTWASYATERDEIARFILEHKIRGVVFLTADYHLARDWTSPRTGLKEYMAGPIASFSAYRRTPAARERYQRSGAFHYGDGPNFGFVRVDPLAERADVNFVDAEGRGLFSASISP